MTTEYQTVPLAHLVESKANPRRITSKTADAELADSVKKMGVLEPLLVRAAIVDVDAKTKMTAFELIAGYRRLAAARAAGLAEVPVRVLDLDDEQALEAAIVENLQRQDVHPLDEADTTARLIEHHKHTVPDVAARVGKSEAYVYQRLALRRLSKKARALFVDGAITAAHALQLVKLEPSGQDEVIKSCQLDRGDRFDGPITAHRLGDFIRHDFFQDLSSAPWKKDDADFVPAAGPCSTCPKRAGAQPGLFADEKVKGETCLDAKCFDAKMKAHLARVKEDLRAGEGRKVLEVSTDYYTREKGVLHEGQFTRVDKKKPCAFATPAVVVSGKERGHALTVCVDAGCKEHRGRGGDGGAETRTWKKKQAAEAKRNKAESARRRAIFSAILAKVPAKLGPEDLRLVARRFVHEMQHDTKQRLCESLELEPVVEKRYGSMYKDWEKALERTVAKLPESGASRFLLAAALVGQSYKPNYDTSPATLLLETAKRYRVDVAKVAKAAAAEKPKTKTKTKAA